MAPTPLLLVEDDVDLAEAISEYLELNGYAVTCISRGMQFYQLLNGGACFQVAIIDIGLPDQSGLVLAEYARSNTNMAVIVITANECVDNRIHTYRSGADLFLAKPIDSRELVEAVAAMCIRYRQRSKENQAPAEQTVGWTLSGSHRQLYTPDGSAIDLTWQEFLIIELFCQAAGDTVERHCFLMQLYKRSDSSAQRALDNLISRLRHKISVHTGQPAPIFTAYGIGHDFTEPLRQL